MLDNPMQRNQRRGFVTVELMVVIGILAMVWPGLITSVRGVYQIVGYWIETVVHQYDAEYWQDQLRQDVNQASALTLTSGWLTIRHPDRPLIQYDVSNTCLRRRIYSNHRWHSYTLVCDLSEWTVDILPGYVRVQYQHQNSRSLNQPLIVGYVCEVV